MATTNLVGDSFLLEPLYPQWMSLHRHHNFQTNITIQIFIMRISPFWIPHHTSLHAMQESLFLRRTTLVSIWFRMVSIQAITWVYKVSLTLKYAPYFNIWLISIFYTIKIIFKCIWNYARFSDNSNRNMTYTRPQNYTNRVAQEYAHSKLWLLWCCHWCCHLMFLSPQVNIPYYFWTSGLSKYT